MQKKNTLFFPYWHQNTIMLPSENTDTSFSWDYQLMSAAERKWKCKEMEDNNLCVQLCTQIQRPELRQFGKITGADH